MYTAVKTLIKGLSKDEFDVLRELCAASGRLYNCGLYNSRQEYFETENIFPYALNCKLLKSNENYKTLQSGCAQQTLKHVHSAMESFKALKDLAASGEYPEDAVRLPKYKRGERYYGIWCSTNAIRIHGRKFRMPFSNSFRKKHKTIWIDIPEYVDVATVKEVSILPRDSGKEFYIVFTCDVEPEDKHLSKSNVLGIDVGVSNLMTCVSTTGDTFIVDGKALKAFNQYYNKEYARLKSIATIDAIGHRKVEKGDRIPITRRMKHLNRYRDNYTSDYMKKAARLVVNYCLFNNIGSIVIGRNKGWKYKSNMGDKNNQNFVFIPYTKLYTQLKYLCERYGIEYIEVNEAYTSKASCLDWDIIPVRRRKHGYEFSGKRKHRGLYVSSCGFCINADVNGAGNILRKGKQNLDALSVLRLCSGLLASPSRLRVS